MSINYCLILLLASLVTSSASFGSWSGPEDMDCSPDDDLLAFFDPDAHLELHTHPKTSPADLHSDGGHEDSPIEASLPLKRPKASDLEQNEPIASTDFKETIMDAQVRRARERLHSVRTFLMALNRIQSDLPLHMRIPRDIRTRICQYVFEPHHLEPDDPEVFTKRHVRDLIKTTPFLQSLSFKSQNPTNLLMSGWADPFREILQLPYDTGERLLGLMDSNASEQEIRSLYKGPLGLDRIWELYKNHKSFDKWWMSIPAGKSPQLEEYVSALKQFAKRQGSGWYIFPKELNLHRNLGGLISLEIFVYGSLENEDWRRLSTLTQLRSFKIDIYDGGALPEDIIYIAQSFRNLICFDLWPVKTTKIRSSPDEFDVAPLNLLIENNIQLRYFNVYLPHFNDTFYSDTLIEHIAKHCPSILFLRLGNGGVGFSKSSAIHLLEARKDLIYIHHGNDNCFYDFNRDEKHDTECAQLLTTHPCLKYMYADLMVDAFGAEDGSDIILTHNFGTTVEVQIKTSEDVRRFAERTDVALEDLNKECIKYRIDLLDGSVTKME